MSESTSEGDVAGGRSPYLADVRQRLFWADDDGEAFDRGSKWFGRADAYAIRTQRKDDRWEASFHRWIDPEAEAEKLAELAKALGSFLDHTRAALNYTVYQLAQLAIRENPALNSPDLPRNKRLLPEMVEYPIVSHPDHFRDHNGIRNLPDKYRDFIEAKEPYEGEDQRLWLLNELAREYRHRVVHPVAIVPIEDWHDVLVNGAPIPISDIEVVEHDRLEHGDVVLRFSLPPGTDPNANVEPQVATTVGIEHPLCRRVSGTRILTEIMAVVAAVTLEIEAEFFGGD